MSDGFWHFIHHYSPLDIAGAVGGADPPPETLGADGGAAAAAAAPDIDIDEALFDPDDLDDLDEELETLDIDS